MFGDLDQMGMAELGVLGRAEFVPAGGERVASTECGHRFHFHCLERHAKAGGTRCPMCRAPLGAALAGAAVVVVRVLVPVVAFGSHR